MKKKRIQKLLRCLVPDCKKEWFLSGGAQGFVMAAALRHGRSHFQKHHDANHLGHHDPAYCGACHPEGGYAVLGKTTL